MHSLLKRTVRSLRGGLLALALAVAPAMTPTVASAQEAALVIFYGSLKVAQSQALNAAANYYQAIGMGQRGQEMLRLASDLEQGTLGGADGVKAFSQVSERLEGDILELQAVGAAPTAQQKELARKARQQFTVARVAMVAAVASGAKVAIDAEGNAMQKILLGVILAAQAAEVLQALDRVSGAAKAYETFELGESNGFQVVSKEALPAFAAL